MAVLLGYVLLFTFVTIARADDIDSGVRRGVMLKMLREMVNQTQADTLNLPANATSIRENITDTFSCENRTYGYYADVDNECQLFHVCLTSDSGTGRNVTYRWSFICPSETLFNQAVLTCTRPRDSIPCEESPMYYHLNDDIGKINNDTEKSENPNENTDKQPNKDRRKPSRKQNIIIESLMKEVNKKENLQAIEEGQFDEELMPVIELAVEKEPVIHDVGEEYVMKGSRMENARLSAERSLKRKARKISRGSRKFKSNI